MESEKKPFDGFRFNKALGQNFISDKNLLGAICADAGIGEGDVVVEIGTGAGTLTEAILQTGAYVHTFEVDTRLEPMIRSRLAAYEGKNELHFADVLKMSDERFSELVPCPFSVVANLPYYVTTPLIMRFLESELPCRSLTLTVQKEVGERLCAPAGSSEYGAVTVSVDSYCDVSITRIIDKKMFFPAPKVDSCVIRLSVKDDKYRIADRTLFRRVVKAVFCNRRKTLENNLKSAFKFSKETCLEIFSAMDIPPMIRGEKLTTEQFVFLTELVEKRI